MHSTAHSEPNSQAGETVFNRRVGGGPIFATVFELAKIDVGRVAPACFRVILHGMALHALHTARKEAAPLGGAPHAPKRAPGSARMAPKWPLSKNTLATAQGPGPQNDGTGKNRRRNRTQRPNLSRK